MVLRSVLLRQVNGPYLDRIIRPAQVKQYGPYTDRIIGRSITDRNIIKIGPYTAVFSQYTDPRILCSKPSVVYGP